jgi:hypothetical protein
LKQRADTIIPDIRSFRDHAKRSTVTADDIKLLARRDEVVTQQLEELEKSMKAAKQTQQAARKRARSDE